MRNIEKFFKSFQKPIKSSEKKIITKFLQMTHKNFFFSSSKHKQQKNYLHKFSSFSFPYFLRFMYFSIVTVTLYIERCVPYGELQITERQETRQAIYSWNFVHNNEIIKNLN